ncbi:MAG: GatB/YqeY domain-containing protein [Patescibacteria group bacterium]
MSTESNISEAVKKAMREHDEFSVTTLRMLMSAIHNVAIAKRVKELPETDVVKVLQAQAKQRREASVAFVAGGRPELADKENKELKIIEGYLPQQMASDEIRKIVQEIVAATGEHEKNFGQVMKAVMVKVAGRSDGQTVSKIVKETLGTS